jgi:Zn finger protein HypA/HybF involved in hydrogenase expression
MADKMAYQATKKVTITEKNLYVFTKYEAHLKCPTCSKDIEVSDFNPATRYHRVTCANCQTDIVIEFKD